MRIEDEQSHSILTHGRAPYRFTGWASLPRSSGASILPGEHMDKKRVAVLISGRGSNMSALIKAASTPAFPAEIALVLSNRGDATGLAHARATGIATAVVDHAAHGANREEFEHHMQAALEANRIDLVCLAGFMRLLTPWFVGRWAGRLLNIHPALLPAFKGLNTHQRALAAGVKIHGASVHFVIPELDSARSSPKARCRYTAMIRSRP